MMDSQENTLDKGQNEVIKEEEVNAQAVETPADESASQVETKEEQPQKVYATKAEILERVREIAHGDETPQKEEVDNLKTAFYKLHIAEREAHIKAFIDGGGDPNQYQIVPDSVEEAFKAEMGIIKEKRAKLFKEQEAEKLENLTKKLAIIDKIKSMITTPEEANKSYQEFKTLQQQWREIKNVPAEKANELWRNYQLYVEQFYDMLRLNSIARDEDFKKNLEAKTRLCEIAENLANEEDIISAFHQLQKLHQEYREIGPVAKEQSTSATSSTSKAFVPAKRTTWPVRPCFVRRLRPSLPRRTRAVATGRSTPSRSSSCSQSGRLSASHLRR